MTGRITSITAFAVLLLVALVFTSATAAIQARHCPTCGQIASDVEMFCAKCGTRLPALQQTLPKLTEQPLDSTHHTATLGDSAILARLSDDELRRLVDLLIERRVIQAQPSLDSNSVALMTRWEMEQMIRKIMAEQPKPKGTSGFATFLQYVGGFVMIIMTIGILGSL